MKLGILGGSFNPIHHGHLSMATAAREAHGLDRVVFLPSGRPPHKHVDLAPAEDRLEMVRLAIGGMPGFVASDLEVARPGLSFTVDSLEALRRAEPGAELYFIVGEDSMAEFPGWREPERILQLARLVVVNRPGSAGRFARRDFPSVPAEVLDRVERDRVRMEPSPLESRAIREAIRAGRSIEGMVPRSVAEYIARRRLYRNVAGPEPRP